MSFKLPEGHWLCTSDLIKELKISKATLYRRKKEGYFELGRHFLTTSPPPVDGSPSTANILWNVESCREVFAFGNHLGNYQWISMNLKGNAASMSYV